MSKTTNARATAHALSALALVLTAVLAAMQAFGSNVLRSKWARLVAVLGLMGAAFLGFERDFYLPFLGSAVIPPSALKVATPADATIAVSIDAPADATHVVYWAASPSLAPYDNPSAAYANFSNAGVVPVAGRRATLRVACPGTYKVRFGRLLPRHVHYRFVFGNGMMSPVKTADVDCP